MSFSSKPTIFVSSTVHDFADLRSCLSFFLERAGYKVQLSEAAAFEKPVLANSYDACFDAIRRADAFLLLIGGRRGGWYEDGKVTITQQEYRVAYDEARTRGLKLIVCVRGTTWAHYSVLKEHAPSTWTSLKVVDDPGHLVSFLKEVGRVDEMKGEPLTGERPVANWIHQFNSFSELVSILEVNLQLAADIGAALLRDVVADEVSSFASNLLGDQDYANWLLANVRSVISGVNRLSISMNDVGSKVRVPSELLGKLVHIALGVPHQTRGILVATERACVSGALAEVDRETLSVRPSALQLACRRVLAAFAEVSRLDSLVASAMQEGANSKHARDWPLSVDFIIAVVASGLRQSTALLEAENIVRHVRLGQALAPDPAGWLRVPLLPGVTGGKPLKAPDKGAFESWTRMRVGAAQLSNEPASVEADGRASS